MLNTPKLKITFNCYSRHEDLHVNVGEEINWRVSLINMLLFIVDKTNDVYWLEILPHKPLDYDNVGLGAAWHVSCFGLFDDKYSYSCD